MKKILLTMNILVTCLIGYATTLLIHRQIKFPETYTSDIWGHVTLVQDGVGYSIADYLIEISLKISNNIDIIAPMTGGVVVLTVYATYMLGCHLTGRARLNIDTESSLLYTAGSLLIFIAAFNITGWFEGYYSSNGLISYITQPWHNITYLWMRPFAVLAFLFYFRNQLAESSKSDLFLFWFFMTLCNFAKPNFFVEFVPVVFCIDLYKIIRKTFNRKDMMLMLLIVASTPIMFLQYAKLYLVESKNTIVFSTQPWCELLDSPIRFQYIVTGLLFPIAVTLLLIIHKYTSMELIMGWGIWIVGMAERLFIVESGTRAADGNFMWGAFAASYLLYAVCLFELVRAHRSRRINWWVTTAALIPLVLNCISGLNYFVGLINGNHFLT